jgi:hypothetical protein
MRGDKKKALSIIIAGLGGGKKPENESDYESEESQEEDEEEESDEGLKSAADDILTAISTKDSDMLSKALRDFVAMC